MIDYTLILSRKYPGAQWILNGDEYSGLVWLADSPKPSKKTLDDLWEFVVAEIQTEKQAKADAKAELLNRLGITAEEAALLLG